MLLGSGSHRRLTHLKQSSPGAKLKEGGWGEENRWKRGKELMSEEDTWIEMFFRDCEICEMGICLSVEALSGLVSCIMIS